MKIVCSNPKCRKFMGVKAPLNNELVTHSLCVDCLPLYYPPDIVDAVIARMEKTTVPDSRVWEEPK